MQTLDTLKHGEMKYIFSFDMEENREQVFRQIGLMQGTEITCLQKSPFGDPIAYLVCGSVFTFRKKDTRHILVMAKEEIDGFIKK